LDDDRNRSPGGWDDEEDRWPHEGEGSWKERYERAKARTPSQSGFRLYGQGVNQAYEVLSYLLGGMLVWGGVGFLVDRLSGFHYLFLPVGLLLGLAGGIYLALAHGKQKGPAGPREEPPRERSGGPSG
jgi:ATP synthase protein I